MFEQAFKNIDDVLWKEAGCTTELDYTEQTSWLLFLKYLDGLEQDRADEAALDGKKYTYILDKPYRWETWAAPKGKDGKLDHNKALTGDDLRDFVSQKLFPYLHGFKLWASGPNTLEYKIGEIFGEIKNKIHSGYNLREIIDRIDELRFRSQAEKHEEGVQEARERQRTSSVRRPPRSRRAGCFVGVCGDSAGGDNRRSPTRRQIIGGSPWRGCCSGVRYRAVAEDAAPAPDSIQGRMRAAEGKECRQFLAPEIGRTYFRIHKKWRHNR